MRRRLLISSVELLELSAFMTRREVLDFLDLDLLFLLLPFDLGFLFLDLLFDLLFDFLPFFLSDDELEDDLTESNESNELALDEVVSRSVLELRVVDERLVLIKADSLSELLLLELFLGFLTFFFLPASTASANRLAIKNRAPNCIEQHCYDF